MVHSGGRPLASLINNNFERLEQVPNSSHRYYWKCRHCGDTDNSSGARIQGHDNNLPNHLIKHCTNAVALLRQAARQFIMEKTGAPTDSNAILTSLAASGSSTIAAIPIKKHKASNLDGYIDRPLSKEQNNLANAKLLRFFIHANIPFHVGDDVFFHEFINVIRPSYHIPSRYVLSRHLLDSEAVRVQQEEINRLKDRKCLTLLLDGWEDLLRRSLYGSLAVEVNHPPVVLALENMTGQRGTAENLVAVSQKAMNHMEVGDGRKFIAVTTDNPTVMQSYHCRNNNTVRNK
ncbi:uncharacterized protein HD556DRAFT_1448416 [Suillus plorans]|uniref:DUF659 domain-containing protein n=1 Tax=Suillus plorans TaxID=116603 RepID=A0A9P7AEM5_9AGAM|nr:uncharacterized protein HD556DRAFT_1448416 [Suillus plorans]KAG1787733.1 hypothetical protein HD556DRAFT_1448416 [Suillus plorans]